MSQFPYDEFSKQIAEVSLELAGTAEPAKTIPGETRQIDFYFLPSFASAAQAVRATRPSGQPTQRFRVFPQLRINCRNP